MLAEQRRRLDLGRRPVQKRTGQAGILYLPVVGCSIVCMIPRSASELIVRQFERIEHLLGASGLRILHALGRMERPTQGSWRNWVGSGCSALRSNWWML